MENSNLYVDVHHHYNPLHLLALNADIKQKIKSGEVRNRDIVQTLEMMEEYGICKSILSFPASFPLLSEKEQVDLCFKVNECYAKLLVRHAGLGAFALLPIASNRDWALQATEYALDTLHLDGVLLPTSVSGIYPGDGIYHDLYKELDRRKATIFLHPIYSGKEEVRKRDMLMIMSEVTRAACELVFNRIVRHYPNIRFILSHGGGNISFFFQKKEQNVLDPNGLSGLCDEKDIPNGIEHYLKKMYYDTAFPMPMNFMEYLGGFADRTKILFGSDFPFSPFGTIKRNLDCMNRYRYDGQCSMAECCRKNSSFYY